MRSLAITVDKTTTRVEVVSEDPPRWATQGSKPRKPIELLRELFEQARTAGADRTAIMYPHLAVADDGEPVETPPTYRAWCFYASFELERDHQKQKQKQK